MDEPTFTLKASDPIASLVVKIWATMNSHTGFTQPGTGNARGCAVDMQMWLEGGDGTGKEPTFTLKASDPLAPKAVQIWMVLKDKSLSKDEATTAGMAIVDMRIWRKENCTTE